MRNFTNFPKYTSSGNNRNRSPACLSRAGVSLLCAGGFALFKIIRLHQINSQTFSFQDQNTFFLLNGQRTELSCLWSTMVFTFFLGIGIHFAKFGLETTTQRKKLAGPKCLVGMDSFFSNFFGGLMSTHHVWPSQSSESLELQSAYSTCWAPVRLNETKTFRKRHLSLHCSTHQDKQWKGKSNRQQWLGASSSHLYSFKWKLDSSFQIYRGCCKHPHRYPLLNFRSAEGAADASHYWGT